MVQPGRDAVRLDIPNDRKDPSHILSITCQMENLHSPLAGATLGNRASKQRLQASISPAWSENVFMAYSLSPCKKRNPRAVAIQKPATTAHVREKLSSQPQVRRCLMMLQAR